MTIQSYEIRALDDFGGRIHWIPSDLGAWCPADSVRRLETDMEALRAEIAASIAVREEMQLNGNRMAESLRFAKEEIADIKAEIDELKASPKALSAEEVVEDGWYWSVEHEEFVQIECDPTILPWRLSMWRVGSSTCSRLQGQFIGPIKMPEV